jgi:Ca2+-binding RTX toxin-like protein
MGWGDDTFADENGSETYIYAAGDGHDVIVDRFSYFRYDPGNDLDRLVLVDLVLADLEFSRVELSFSELGQPGNNALQIRLLSTNETIRVVDQFLDDLSGLEEIVLADGIVLGRAQIAALAYTYGTELDDTLFGSGTLVGRAGDDAISGWGEETRVLWSMGDGNDTLYGVGTLELRDVNSNGVRLLTDDTGTLWVQILATGEVITVQSYYDPEQEWVPPLFELRFASGQIWGAAEMLANVAWPTSDDADEVTGTDLANRILGRGGDDTLYGGLGDDTLDGGAGNDMLYGGDGDDLILLSEDGETLIDGGDGLDTVSAAQRLSGVVIDLSQGLAAGTPVTGVENVIGSRFADTLTGDDGANRLAGGAGNDTLYGGLGDDTLAGGRGADLLDGGAGRDVADYASSLSGVIVALDGTMGQGGDAAGDILIQIEDLIGSNYSDRLTGDGAANRIWAGNGSDTLFGGAGDDTLWGQAGADQISGGDGEDLLYGGDGRDTLLGGAGDDTLFGDRGADRLEGGEGSDTYVWQRGDGDDLIVDTGAAGDVDRLHLTDVTVDQVSLLRLGDRLHIAVHGGETIRIDQYFNGAGIEIIEFADGTELNRAQIADDVQEVFNLAPIAFNDTGRVSSVPQFQITAAELLANDFDYEGDALTLTEVSDAVGGTVEMDAEGNLSVSAFAGATEVSFRYRVSDGTSSTQALVSVAINAANAAPVVDIALPDRVMAEDRTFSFALPAGTFRDPDSDPLQISVIGPDWLSFDGTTFTAAPPANFNGRTEIEVIASDGELSVSDRFFLTVTPVNDAPTGAVTLTGAARQGATLRANTAGLADADGLGAFSYQWFAGGRAIAGATGDSLTLGQAQVGKPVTVQLRYTDGDGTRETVTSAPTAPIVNVNDAPTGSVSILGTPVSGRVLTGLSTLADADGLGPLRYQWFADGAAISGATSRSLLLSPDLVGQTIGLRVSYTDGQGTLESRSALATSPVVLGPILGTAAADVLAGTAGNDTIVGLAGNDVIRGLAGNDSLLGGGGKDRLLGGAGDDLLLGGGGNDRLRGGAGSDRLEGGAGRDLLDGGAGDDLLLGGGGNDRLRGGAGSDRLEGGKGKDVLDGGKGSDLLIGGAGADRFVFKKGYGADLVSDFSVRNGDMLLLDDALWSGNLSVAAVIDRFGTNVRGDAALAFGGGNVVVFDGVTDINSLSQSILLI